MLSLMLFRHGKSDWDAPFASDHERPLAPRGRDAARCMGRLLAQTRQVPDLAISSSAQRARATLQLAAKAGGWSCPTRIESALYDAAPNALLTWLKSIDGDVERLMLIGHEPTWSALAGKLIGGGLIKMPTAAVARIDFEVETWQQVEPGQGELRWLLPPKLVCRLKGASKA